MKKFTILILLIMLLAFICACNNTDNHKKVRKLSFNSIIVEKYTSILYPGDKKTMTRTQTYCLKLSNFGLYDGESIFSYSWNKKNHYLPETDLEIIFTRERLSNHFLAKPENCLIGCRIIENKLKAFFICWQNKPIKVGDHNMAEYNWDVSGMTDSLFTNLSKEQIKSLFPNFKGNYSFRNVDTIYLNYDDPMLDCNFFNTIKFRCYILGYEKMEFRLYNESNKKG